MRVIKNCWKKFKKTLKHVLSFLDQALADKKRGVPVLTYHMVNPSPLGEVSRLRVLPKCFQEQIHYLTGQGYNLITLGELVSAWIRKDPLPPKPVVITFDDGYQDNFTFAFPVLKQYGFKATLFVVVNTIGCTNIFDKGQVPVNKMMGWQELREMADYGIEIGAHTLDHPKLTQLSKETAFHQIADSKINLEYVLGQPVSAFSYPHGDFNNRLVKLVKKCGYLAAVTVNHGLATPDRSRYKIKRINVSGDYSLEEFICRLENAAKPRLRG